MKLVWDESTRDDDVYGRPGGEASPMTSRTQWRGHLTDGTGSQSCRESSTLGIQRCVTAG